MGTALYYTPPTETAFEDMKKSCIELWRTKGNAGGYSDEKIHRIENIQNISDNFMYMFAMLDINNQRIVADKLSPETKKAVRERMVDGGNPEYLINQVLGE